MEVHNGNCAVSARINIDYQGKKPKVSFSYPDKKNQQHGSLFVHILIVWLIINLPLGLYLQWFVEEYSSILLWIYLVVGYLLIYLPFRLFWTKIYPDVQAALSFKKLIVFKPSDVKKEQEYFCELPVFNNVVCDFDAVKDFGKYLKQFEIREHNFKYLGFRKKYVNESLWYARFYFKSKPLNGELRVVFK